MPPELRRLRAPLSAADARTLQLGDMVLLDGEVVVSAGLAAHVRLLEHVDAGRAPPLALHGASFLHLGVASAPGPDGRLHAQYANPTTSTRFNAQMPRLIRHFGFHAVGGKGGLDAPNTAAMRDAGCVYLALPGGGSPLISDGVCEVLDVQWQDFVSHFRLSKLRVAGLGPATVSIDAHGNSLYGGLAAQAQARLPAIMAQLRAARGEPHG